MYNVIWNILWGISHWGNYFCLLSLYDINVAITCTLSELYPVCSYGFEHDLAKHFVVRKDITFSLSFCKILKIVNRKILTRKSPTDTSMYSCYIQNLNKNTFSNSLDKLGNKLIGWNKMTSSVGLIDLKINITSTTFR